MDTGLTVIRYAENIMIGGVIFALRQNQSGTTNDVDMKEESAILAQPPAANLQSEIGGRLPPHAEHHR